MCLCLFAACGETATIAEEMAARDALSRVWGTTLGAAPLPFGEKGHRLQVDLTHVNPSLEDYKTDSNKLLEAEQKDGTEV